jgi:hypothetical protein
MPAWHSPKLETKNGEDLLVQLLAGSYPKKLVAGGLKTYLSCMQCMHRIYMKVF